MVQIKICGNHHFQDIHVLSPFKQSIDYIGFIFTSQSKRWVNPEEVKRWLDQYPWLRPKAVAVFMNQSIAEICQVVSMTQVPFIQLHGEESPSFCKEVLTQHPHLLLWKTISVQQQKGDIMELEEKVNPYLPLVDTILLDTQLPHHIGGGTGRPFDWSLIPPLYRRLSIYNHENNRPVKLFVAGGISAQNVGQLLMASPVDGIDLASGAEHEGFKDKERIKALLEEVKRYGSR